MGKKIMYPYYRTIGQHQGMSLMRKTFPIIRGDYADCCVTVVPFDTGRARIRIHGPNVNPYGKNWRQKCFQDDYFLERIYDSKCIHPTSTICRALDDLGVDMSVVFSRYEAKEDWLKTLPKNFTARKKIVDGLYVQRKFPKYAGENEQAVWEVYHNAIYTGERGQSFLYHMFHVGYVYQESPQRYHVRISNPKGIGYPCPGRKSPNTWRSVKSAAIGLVLYAKFRKPEKFGVV